MSSLLRPSLTVMVSSRIATTSTSTKQGLFVRHLSFFRLTTKQQQQKLRSKIPPSASSVLFKSTSVPYTKQLDTDENKNKKGATAAAKVSTSTTVAPLSTSSNGNSGRISKPFLYNLGIPSLLPEWRNMLQPSTLITDIAAGITVGCIAVPLNLAIAMASGVPAEVGLVTAAISGVMGGLLGGTTLAVTGPAAAISLLVVGAVTQHGFEALPVITLGCGVLQLLSGVTRLGVVAKLVPVSVIAGFTTGVGSLILAGQVPKALGMAAAPAGMNPLQVVGYVATHMATDVNMAAAALAVGTSLGMYYLPKIHAKIPSALLAVGGATVATQTLGLDSVALIGSIPSGLSAFSMGLPQVPGVESMPGLAMTTLLIYGMTSAESLLSCVAVDKMKKTTYKHNPDQELIGQGLANMGSAFCMGMPVTSVIARSSLNVRLNAETRLPGIVQAGFVFSSVVFLSETISMIPTPALSGMLITTGMAMLNPVELKHCLAVQKSDILPFFVTIGGMVSLGLAEGIGMGCVSALALNYGRWSATPARLQTQQTQMVLPFIEGLETTNNNNNSALKVDDATKTVWKLQGPINFISMLTIDDLMEEIDRHQTQTPQDVIVLDMEGVTAVEFTGAEELTNRLLEIEHTHGTPIKFIHCHEALLKAMKQCDPSQKISCTQQKTVS